MNKEEFIIECKNIGLDVTPNIMEKLNIYFKMLVEWNDKFNLTSILDEKDVYLKHFYDSICVVKSDIIKNETKKVCDFGTGAGFPGIIIKIFFDKINLTLIESNLKKCGFLSEVVKNLNLENVNIINDRAELSALKNKEVFDIVTCRAVSALRIIDELAIPMLKINGYFLPLKSNLEEEFKDAKESLNYLGAIIKRIVSYELPIEKSKRNLVVIKKISKTDNKYPRPYKDILKHLK